MKKKNNIKKIIIFFSFTIIAFFVVYIATKEAYRSSKIEREVEALRNEAEEIKVENLELREKISYFETNDFQEKMAKERLNLQKKDEKVIIVKQNQIFDKNKESEEDTVNTLIPEKEKENYEKWWNQFFSY